MAELGLGIPTSEEGGASGGSPEIGDLSLDALPIGLGVELQPSCELQLGPQASAWDFDTTDATAYQTKSGLERLRFRVREN